MKKLFCVFALVAVVYATTCPMSEGDLDSARRETVVAIQNSPNLNCGDFRQFLVDFLEEDATWFNPGVGVFAGHSSIDEYYQLVLSPGGGCGNALGFQPAKLATTPLPTSIEQVGPNRYAGNWGVDGFFGPLPPFDGNTWAFPSYGHYFKGDYNFTECSAKVNYFVTLDEGLEILYVGDVLGAAQQLDPLQWCGLMSVAQGKFFGEQGYNPANISGFDFFSPTGFLDCFQYHGYLTAKGSVCGTNLVDHTAGCFLRHILTYLTFGASPGHANHWAKEAFGNTKCIDRCVDVLATCHPDANRIPNNRVLRDEGVFEYFCQCPVGYKGDGVAACDPVTCTSDSDCKPNQASFCDTTDSLCKPHDSFEWNTVEGMAECPENHTPWLNISTSRFDCVRADKCWDARECPQNPTRVSCQYPGNLASPFGVCFCNAGYEGGFDIECTCPSDKTETNVSPGFKVCLGPDECTMNDHCASEQSCSSSSYNEIGVCQ